ncbi:MAG: 3D domain-containing protein [Anaerovoracaceae bacterium]
MSIQKKIIAGIMTITMACSIIAIPTTQVWAEDSGEIVTPPPTESTIKISAPKSVKAKCHGITSIKVTWKKVSGATGYKIYRYTKGQKHYALIGTKKGSGSLTYLDKKSTTGKAYGYRIKAYKTVTGKTIYSKYSPRSCAKAVPKQASAKAKAGKNKVKISWKKIDGAQGYHIYRSTSSKGKFKCVKVISKGKTTSCINGKLRAGRTYYYKVRGYKKVNGKKVFGKYSKKVKAKAKGLVYKKKFTVKAYAYTGGGITASGLRAKVGRIAVDPRVIPLGKKVYVSGYGYAVAADTGGNIKGRTIDVYKNSERQCRNWGVRYKTIYIL